jgi:hypothetical protein
MEAALIGESIFEEPLRVSCMKSCCRAGHEGEAARAFARIERQARACLLDLRRQRLGYAKIIPTSLGKLRTPAPVVRPARLARLAINRRQMSRRGCRGALSPIEAALRIKQQMQNG